MAGSPPQCVVRRKPFDPRVQRNFLFGSTPLRRLLLSSRPWRITGRVKIMAHDPRLIRHEDTIEDLKPAIPDWIKNLKRPATPCVVPAFGPLEGIRVVGTGQLVAQPLSARSSPSLARR